MTFLSKLAFWKATSQVTLPPPPAEFVSWRTNSDASMETLAGWWEEYRKNLAVAWRNAVPFEEPFAVLQGVDGWWRVGRKVWKDLTPWRLNIISVSMGYIKLPEEAPDLTARLYEAHVMLSPTFLTQAEAQAWADSGLGAANEPEEAEREEH